jgi:hypothetical protein
MQRINTGPATHTVTIKILGECRRSTKAGYNSQGPQQFVSFPHSVNVKKSGKDK